MLEINCFKFIFGYLYFSPTLFVKYNKNPGGQLEIRLSVYKQLAKYRLS